MYRTSCRAAELFLTDFGSHPDNDSIDFACVKEFLVQVLKPGTHIKTMDELWHFIYHQTKKSLTHILHASYMYGTCVDHVYGRNVFLSMLSTP